MADSESAICLRVAQEAMGRRPAIFLEDELHLDRIGLWLGDVKAHRVDLGVWRKVFASLAAIAVAAELFEHGEFGRERDARGAALAIIEGAQRQTRRDDERGVVASRHRIEKGARHCGYSST